jgi:hypothetical protein
MLWQPGKTHTTMVEQTAENSHTSALAIARDHSDWQSLRVLQILLGTEDVEVAREAGGRDFLEPSRSGHLSPITEGDEENQSGSGESLGDYLSHSDPVTQEALTALHADWSSCLVDAPAPPPDVLQSQSDRMPLQYFQDFWLNMEAYPRLDEVPGKEDDSVELAAEPPMTKLLEDRPFLAPNQQLVFKTSATGTGRVVTQRDDDLLTPAEVKERWPEVEKPMYQELMT